MKKRATMTQAAPPEVTESARKIAHGIWEKNKQNDSETARILGVSQASMWRFLKGKSGVGFPMLFALQEATGMSLDEVCGRPLRAGAKDIARLYLGTRVTPQGVRLAEVRAEASPPRSPQDWARMMLDAERDLALAVEEDITHTRAKSSVNDR